MMRKLTGGCVNQRYVYLLHKYLFTITVIQNVNIDSYFNVFVEGWRKVYEYRST